jgi:hypothetical protein
VSETGPSAEPSAEPSPQPSPQPSPEPSPEPSPTRSLVAPLDVDAVRTVQVGTVIWGLLLIGLLPFRSQLVEDDRTWWLWTCALGVVFGLVGIGFTVRRRRRIRNRAG